MNENIEYPSLNIFQKCLFDYRSFSGESTLSQSNRNKLYKLFSKYQDVFESCGLDLETVLPFLEDADEQTTIIKMNSYSANENDLSYNAMTTILNVSRNSCTCCCSSCFTIG